MTEPIDIGEEWARFTARLLFDCSPEYVETPYPHLILTEPDLFPSGPKWWATLDTYGDVMHLALRSGSYAGLECGDRTPGAIAQWFDDKVTEVMPEEYCLMRELEAEGKL